MSAVAHKGIGEQSMPKPVDPDSEFWALFSLTLREGETVTTAEEVLENATVVDAMQSVGTVTVDGVSYANCYGVKVKPEAGARKVKVTIRFSTTMPGAVNLGETQDRTMVFKVKSL